MARTNTNWSIVYLFEDRANKINCKKHFNPRELDLTIEKIAKNEIRVNNSVISLHLSSI